MNNPSEQILTRIYYLTDNLQFKFSNIETINIQHKKLDYINNELIDIYNNLGSSIKAIKPIIDEINRKIATTVAASLAISLFSNNDEEEEDNSWIKELCDSIFSNFADDLLDESISDYIKHNVQDPNGLQSLYNSLVSIENIINIKINQVNNLKLVANYCLTNKEIIRYLDNNINGVTFEKHKLLFNNFFFKSKFSFSFNSMNFINNEFSDLKVNLEEIINLHQTLNKFYNVIKVQANNYSNISSEVILTIISFFGNNLRTLEYNKQGDLIWIISSISYSLNNLLNESNSLNEYYTNSLNAVTELYNLVESCINNNAFIELINNPPESKNLGSFSAEINNKVNQIKPILPIANKDKLLKKVEIFKAFNQDLKATNINFKTIHNNSLKKSYFSLNYNSLIALISLFGTSIKTIGFTKEGEPSLTIENNIYPIQEFLKQCSMINEIFKNYLPKINYLSAIGKQILSNTRLSNLIMNENKSITLDDFFLNFNKYSENLSIDFDLNNRSILNIQINNFEPIFEESKTIRNAMTQIINCQDELSLNTSVLEKYIFLFGRIQFIGFDQQGSLYFHQDNKKYIITEIQKQCNVFLPKIVKKLDKVNKSFQLGKKCLTDESFREQTIKEKKENKIKLIIYGTLIPVLIILLSWVGYNQTSKVLNTPYSGDDNTQDSGVKIQN